MPLSRLENFLINTEGNILYVNPNDLDSTDSFDNKGNSLTRPFKTIQRALIESARFAYQSGPNNDRFDRTTILLYPGTHTIDNRPGLAIKSVSSQPKYWNFNGNDVSASINLELTNTSPFDLNNSSNILYLFNSTNGGVIVPKGTSIVGMDLRKTKIRPLYVPDPTKNDSTATDYVPRSTLFRVTGGCYFWQFSMFDANQSVYYEKSLSLKKNPSISHHKLSCFEYADGINAHPITGLSDLQMYYYKLMNAYGQSTGNRVITQFPTSTDFEPNTPEFKIVGDLVANDNGIVDIEASGDLVTVYTNKIHGLSTDDSIRIAGIGASVMYEGSYKVSGITTARGFTYYLPTNPSITEPTLSTTDNPRVIIEADNVDGASPYIFNCSLRSTYGMCGLHADGSKATGFKSMVVAQFTGIGLQKDDNAFILYNNSSGTYNASGSITDPEITKPLYINQDAVYKPEYENFHIKVSNDAVIQAVSTFAIGFASQFLSESGGEQSITNSNSNFGSKALLSHGFRKEPFDRDDAGYVTHIVPPRDLQEDSFNVIWRVIDPTLTLTKGLAANSGKKLYLLGEDDKNNPPSNISNGFRVGANSQDKLYLDVSVSTGTSNYYAPILMQVPSGDGPTGEKRFTIKRDGNNDNDITTGSDTIKLNANHNFSTGESVRIFSDDCTVPDGLENGKLYYVIVTGTADEIKLAGTFNKANQNEPVNISNKDGGIISVVSNVTDKVPGELGHPVQWDSSANNWYVTSSTDNGIYGTSPQLPSKNGTGFIGFSTQISSNNSTTYIQRVAEGRELSNRIYRLRYVIPKVVTETGAIAKKPEKNYSLQESRTVDEKSIIVNENSNRNPRVIAGITTDSDTVTITSELPHKLSPGDGIKIKHVLSNRNTTGLGNTGFNGYYYVDSTPTTKTFTYKNANNGGTFTQNNSSLRAAGIGNTLPSFERSEYDTNYTIQDVDTVQEYIKDLQDGVYYLTCMIGNIKPTVEPFNNLKFKQNVGHLYPTVDRDNLNNDPIHAVSSALSKTIGKVDTNNPQNSITKETTINYLKDNRIGIGISGAIGNANNLTKVSGIATVFTEYPHNLSGIVTTTVTGGGSGYGNNATLYNMSLANNVPASQSGDGATGIVYTNGSGAVASVTIVDGGSAYSVGDVLKVGPTGNATVTVSQVTQDINRAVQVVGVGTIGNRTNSGYNGLHRISGISSSKSITYDTEDYGYGPGSDRIGYTGEHAGITTAPQGILFVTDFAVGIGTIVGIAGTTSAGIVTVTTEGSHGLTAGNKIRMVDVSKDVSNGSNSVVQDTYNADFVVVGITSLSTFTVKSTRAIPVDTGISGVGVGNGNGYVLKYGLSAFGQSKSFESEKIAGSLIPLNVGVTTSLSASLTLSGTGSDEVVVPNTLGFLKGDFIQIDNEVIRIQKLKTTAPTTTFEVIRGVMGTRAVAHDVGSVIRKIKVIPSQTHRFSSIRASGHTFEYVGYGPGNYSTALPSKQKRTLTSEEESLAISREEKGGVVFFSGMNDRGDYFTGERITPRENFLADVGSNLSATFDDLYVRNTLRVGGGPNRNLPSEFRGPVNFTSKITSTAGISGDPASGIEAIKLLLKKTATQSPSFLVGDETAPSFVIDEFTQNVGINKVNPEYKLDVSGGIRADAYHQFQLADLPTKDLEPTFSRNRILMVRTDESGYELVDSHELPAYELRSYGVSNDPSIYFGRNCSTLDGGNATFGTITGDLTAGTNTILNVPDSCEFMLAPGVVLTITSGGGNVTAPSNLTITDIAGSGSSKLTVTVDQNFTGTGTASGGAGGVVLKASSAISNKLTISGISTDRFYLNERVKIFGADKLTLPTFDPESNLISNPVYNSTDVLIEKAGTGGESDEVPFPNANSYYYWIAEYDKRTGRVGVSSQISKDPALPLTPNNVIADGNPATVTKFLGIGHTDLDKFNASDFIRLKLRRSSLNNGIIVYRQSVRGYNNDAEAAVADITKAKLVAILGESELKGVQEGIVWNDYGMYEKTSWSPKTDYEIVTDSEGGVIKGNEFVGTACSDNTIYYPKDTDQIHFSETPSLNIRQRGWQIDEVVAIGKSSITLANNYSDNRRAGYGSTNVIKVVHDNTYGFKVAIDKTIASGGNYLTLPSGTYLTNNVILPSSFTIKGNGKNSYIKQQYFATDANDAATVSTDGGGNSLTLDGNLIGVEGGSGIGLTAYDMTLQDLTIDGNSSNNVTFADFLDNDLLYFNYVQSATFKDIEVRNTPGGGINIQNSKRVSVENSSFVDGCLSDQKAYRPLDAQNSQTVRINDCLFENFPGPVDLSVTSVVSTGGNIIRNCGTGIDAYATGKITTSNNIILGPSDEWVPSPDIYDSDWNSINVTVNSEEEFKSPKYLYLEEGEPKDMSSGKVTVTARIAELVGLYNTMTTPSLGDTILELDPWVPDEAVDAVDRSHGYFGLEKVKGNDGTDGNPEIIGTWKLRGYKVGIKTALGYEAVATEYSSKPSGFAEAIGIKTGYWSNGRLVSGTYVNTQVTADPTVSIAATQYTVQLLTPSQYTGINTGHVVKLPQHAMGPDFTDRELIISEKISVNDQNKKLVLNLPCNVYTIKDDATATALGFDFGNNRIELTGTNLTTGDSLTYVDCDLVTGGLSGINTNTTYFVREQSTGVWSLHPTKDNANDNANPITLASSGNTNAIHKFATGALTGTRGVGTAQANGGENGYISIRNIFTIFKGRVGVI